MHEKDIVLLNKQEGGGHNPYTRLDYVFLGACLI